MSSVSEALRLGNLLGERLLLIYVGDKEEETEQQILEVIAASQGALKQVELIWETGDTVTAMLKVARQQEVDLIIAGAEPREGLLRYYMGSVARRLLRKSNCSVLLLTNPEGTKKHCGRIVVNGSRHPKTPETVHRALEFAERVEANQVIIVDEVETLVTSTGEDDPVSAKKADDLQKRMEQEERDRIDEIITHANVSGVIPISQKLIFGKKGYSIGHYTESTNADLLVINSPDTKLGFLDRVFTQDLEYILSELPSDLLIVHSQKN